MKTLATSPRHERDRAEVAADVLLETTARFSACPSRPAFAEENAITDDLKGSGLRTCKRLPAAV